MTLMVSMPITSMCVTNVARQRGVKGCLSMAYTKDLIGTTWIKI